MNGKTVAITGGTGFIGTALARLLLARGYGVRIFTRRIPEKRVEGAQYSEVSFDSKDSLKAACEGADFLVHMAAVLFSRSRAGFEKVNVQGTANLVAAAAALPKPPEKFVYISSLAAGGPSPAGAPRTEETPDAPVSEYGRTKLGGEKEVQRLPPFIRRTILRPPIVYGRNEYAVSKIAHWVKKGFMVNAGAAGSFNFVYVEDLAAAVITALENPATDGNTYYVCENRAYPWQDFIAMLAAAMGVKMPFMVNLPAPLLGLLGLVYEAVSWAGGAEPVFNRDKAKEGAAPNWTASSSRWEKDTAWPGWTPLAEGIKKTFG
ncbi:MAG: NAD(P)-dependent oxidoreductase [Elusimicrobiales bacterium]|nr:NAD(P)-dependent oxidoreductase [Elusimicrobiales bacterium]